MIRFLSTLIALSGLGYGIYWANQTYPDLNLKTKALQWISTGTVSTFKARFTPDQIMESQKRALHKSSSIALRPYLLMEIKYTTKNFKTKEGFILWDLADGEMVLDTANWKKTHGFADCMNAHAGEYEYKILSAIEEHGGKANRDTLVQALDLETHLFNAWLDKARKKKLVVHQGGFYRIHLQDPHIKVPPTTTLSIPLITTNSKIREKIPRRYSPSQVKKGATAFFGDDFAIRSADEVYLPIYSITTQNSDGLESTTYWNGLTGQKF